MLVVLLKKQIMRQKICDLEKKITDHNHITTSKSNTLAARVFKQD